MHRWVMLTCVTNVLVKRVRLYEHKPQNGGSLHLYWTWFAIQINASNETKLSSVSRVNFNTVNVEATSR